MGVEKTFSCHTYSKRKKIKLVALEFTDYAFVWWDDHMQKERVRYHYHLGGNEDNHEETVHSILLP